MASAKLIAIDFDEVLFPLFTEYANYFQKNHSKPVRLPLKYPYHYATALGTSEESARETLTAFFASPEHANMKPIAGSVSTLKKLKEDGWDLAVVTARPKTVSVQTQYLLDKHFKGMFGEVIYCNYYTPFKVPKYRICESMGARMIVDDSHTNCLECLDIGVGAVHFVGNPVYPWCNESNISARTWDDIYEILA